MREVDNLMCGTCRWSGDCRCIDHRYVHFFRPWFSCDVMTSHHTICSEFSPTPHTPAIYFDWHENGGWEGWYPLYVDQWLNGKTPKTIPLILAKKPPHGCEFGDDVYNVPYEDFINCNIMRPDGIHYKSYRHIEISRKSPTGYAWHYEGPGILRYEDLEEKNE